MMKKKSYQLKNKKGPIALQQYIKFYCRLNEKNLGFRRNMLSVSAAKNFFIIQRGGKRLESYKPSVKVEFSPSHCSHVFPFSLSLVEERDQVLPNKN